MMKRFFCGIGILLGCYLPTLAQNLVKAEYYFDGADPGVGLGTALTVSSSDEVDQSFNISLSGVSSGVHSVSARVRNVNGFWSTALTRYFYVVPSAQLSASADIVSAEYFLDGNDPGTGSGTFLAISSGASVESDLTIDLGSLTSGVHSVSVRVKDGSSQWSTALTRYFYVVPAAQLVPSADVVSAEYFLDGNDPGTGSATALAISSGASVDSNLTIDLGSLTSGVHTVSVRVKDGSSQWSTALTRYFYVVPVALSSNAQLVALEYYIDTDPGFGNGTLMSLAFVDNTTQMLDVDPSSLSEGAHTVYVRAKDEKGVWSFVSYGQFTVGPPKQSQAITFEPLASATYGDGVITLQATSTSNLVVAFESSDEAIATISGNELTITGAGEVTITANQVGDETYMAAPEISQVFTISKASLEIKADDLAKIYGAELPESTLSLTGFLNGDDEQSIELPIATINADASSVVGQYSITLAGGSSQNYELQLVEGTLSVNKAPLSVTANSASRVYGAPNPSFTLIYEGFVLNDDENDLTPPVLSTLADENSNVGTYEISISGGSSVNYEFNFISGVLTIEKADQVITFESLANKTYGEVSFTLTATSDSGLPISYASEDETIATIVDGELVLTGAGSTNIVASQSGNENYNAATKVTQSFQVEKATVIATGDDQAMTFGSEVPTLTISYVGFVGNEDISVLDVAPTASTSASNTSDVGSYPITLSGGSDNNYNLTLSDGTLTINKADQVITITSIADQNLSSGSIEILATTTSGLGLNYDISGPGTLQDNVITFTGGGTIGVTVSQYGNTNYNAAEANLNFNVLDDSKQDQTITFSTLGDKTYGDASISLSASSSSSLAVSFSLVSGPATLSGNTITITGAGTVIVEANQAGNSAFNPASAVQRSFQVAKANLSATADNLTITYSEAIPILTLVYAGFVNNEDLNVLDAQPSMTTSATSNSDAGSYPITLSGGSDNNYNLNLFNGTLTINKADQVITITSIADQNLSSGSIEILATTTSGLGLNYDISGPGTLQDNVITFTGGGTIGVTVSQYGNTNYNAAEANLNFNVLDDSKQDQTITFSTLGDKTYGDAPISLSASSSSSLAVSFSLVSGPATLSGNTITIIGAGTVIVDANQAGNSAFNPASAVQQSFQVAKADLEIKADDLTMTYGEVLPVATISYSGFVNGESDVHLLSKPQVSTEATSSSDAGTYVLNISGATSDNYEFMYVAGTLTINKAGQLITINEIGTVDLNDEEAPLTYFITATSNTGLELTYDVSGPATLSENVLTLSGESGTVSIIVSQIGDQNYLAAQAQISFEVIGLNVLSSEEIINVSQINVFPNPVTTEVNIILENAISSNYHLEIVAVSGVSLWQKDYVHVNSVHEFVDMKLFGEGLYFLKVETLKETKIIKLIVR